jgi:hypothetical protein
MDGYFNRNKMSITLEDWHNTVFASPWGNVCLFGNVI